MPWQLSVVMIQCNAGEDGDYYDAGLDDAGPALLVTQLTMIIELPWQVSLAAGTVSGHRGCDGRACLMDREFPPYPPTPPPPTPEPFQNKTPQKHQNISLSGDGRSCLMDRELPAYPHCKP